jgi:uncharacterized membrane protein YphA (DoxX/SURF4 family)
MMARPHGRIILGGAAILFGVVSLMWHGSDMWQRLRPIGMPFAAIVAWCLAIAQVTGGVAIMYARTARWASILLGAVYLLFALACIPGMIAAPANYGSYVDFFEQLSIVSGALGMYAIADTHELRSAMLGRLARIGLGVCAVSFAWAQVVYFQYTASLVPTWIPPNQVFWTVLTTIAFALAAIAILVNCQARLAIRLMALMMALFGVLVWVPHIVAQPAALSNWSEFGSNYLMTGAAWTVAAAPSAVSRTSILRAKSKRNRMTEFLNR